MTPTFNALPLNARRFALAASLALLCGSALAQSPDFKPEVGQAGKDVVWVPTSQVLVDRMLDMAKLTPNDFHMDLGSGDGRTVITAAKRGARSLGIEYNPDMVAISQKAAAAAGVTERAQFRKADIFETDFSQANVITLFLLPDLNLRLRPTILSMKPGTRIVSNSFTMGEWQDDETATVDAKDGCSYWCIAHLWIVPAKIEGTWKSAQGEMTLGQQFQMVSGTVRTSGAPATLNGKLRGDDVTLTTPTASYRGRVNGDAIEGTVTTGGNTAKWTATRSR